MKTTKSKEEPEYRQITDIDSLLQMAENWRKDYEKNIGKENNAFLVHDLAEEIDMYVNQAVYKAFKRDLISKADYQKILAKFWSEWTILVQRIKEVEEEFDFFDRMSGKHL
jgi:adenine-specific DNA methylase